MNISLHKLIANAGLLAFIIAFVEFFAYFFGEQTIYISSFAVTAMLIFSRFSLKVPPWFASILFPTLFCASVFFPYFVHQSSSFILSCLLLIASLTMFLFLLAPSLDKQSYVPFLCLYALNLSAPSQDLGSDLSVAFLSGGIVGFIYLCTHHQETNSHLLKYLFLYFQHRLLFILQLLVGIFLAYIIGLLLHSWKTAWIILTVITLTEVDLEYTKKKLISKVLATLVGVIIYAFFLLFVNQYIPHAIPLLLILISYIYTFVENYFVKIIFITFNALNAAVATEHLPTKAMMESRLSFILIGGGITIITALLFHYLNHHKTNLIVIKTEHPSSNLKAGIKELHEDNGKKGDNDNYENMESDASEINESNIDF